MKQISRRDFLKAGAATAVVAGAMGSVSFAEEAPAMEEEMEEYVPSSVEDTDVVVVGMGVSGILAMCAAADKGAKVIGLDPCADLVMTNACQTAGIWGVGTKPQLACEKHLEPEWCFKFLNEATHFQSNAKTLSAMINNSGRALDTLIDAGMSFFFPFEDQENYENIGVLNQGGHVWMVWGVDRANEYQTLLFDVRPNIDTRWSTRAVKLLTEDGKVTGVLALNTDTEEVSQINAKSVVICTGGFVHNAEMVKKYFAGARMIGPGNIFCDGSGIQLAQSVGAQIGKNFSTSTNESGSGNSHASGLTFANGTDNSLFNLPLFGTLFLDGEGNRFMDESKMCEQTMYCGEPLLRDPAYYVIIDQNYVDKLMSTPIVDFMGEQAIANMAPVVQMSFNGQTLTNLEDDLAAGMEDGYVWKADTLEELQEATGLKNLVASVEAYNGYVESGKDTEMYKDAAYMKDAVLQPPFYAVQEELSCWLTLGGIKTNGKFQALGEDNMPIEGLYIAGADADLWGVPYYQGGSAQGFCFVSGFLAGEAAAEA